jgi:hypothetical protein
MTTLAERLTWLARCLEDLAERPSQQGPDQWRSCAITLSHMADAAAPLNRQASIKVRVVAGMARGLAATTPFHPADIRTIRHLADVLRAAAETLSDRPSPPPGAGTRGPNAGGRMAAA